MRGLCRQCCPNHGLDGEVAVSPTSGRGWSSLARAPSLGRCLVLELSSVVPSFVFPAGVTRYHSARKKKKGAKG